MAMMNMEITKKYINEITYKIIGACIEVHKIVGPGLYEEVYHKCLEREFDILGLKYQKDKNTLKITITTLIGAIVSVVLSILLITKIGLQGVSIAFLVGFMIMVLTRYYDIFRREISIVFLTLIILAPIPIYLLTSLISKIIEHLV